MQLNNNSMSVWYNSIPCINRFDSKRIRRRDLRFRHDQILIEQEHRTWDID